MREKVSVFRFPARNAPAKMGGDLLESDTGREYPISDLAKHKPCTQTPTNWSE